MITHDRLSSFVELVQRVRFMQAEYRRTIDSRLRHRLPLLEEQLDRDAQQLTKDLAALALQAEAEVMAEGGAA